MKIRIKNWLWYTLVIQILGEENAGRPWIQGQLQSKMAGLGVGKPVGDSQKLATKSERQISYQEKKRKKGIEASFMSNSEKPMF